MSGRAAFQTAAVVSSYTGRLLCKMDDVYEVCSFLVGRPVYTHELPDVFRQFRRHGEVPQWLADLDTSGVNRENWQAFRDALIEQHGATMEISPLSWSPTTDTSPVETLAEMIPDKPIIVVEIEEAA